MKKVIFIFLTAGSFSYSSPCEDAMASSKILPAQKKRVNLLEQSLQNPNVDVRIKAVYATGGIGGSALSVLETALEDQSLYVRFKAAELLLQKNGLALPLQLKILSVLKQILTHRLQLKRFLKESEFDDMDRLDAVAVLKRIRTVYSLLQSQILFALEKDIKDSDNEVRLEAVEAAGAIGKPARSLIQLKDLSLSEKLQFWKAQFQMRMYGVIEKPL